MTKLSVNLNAVAQLRNRRDLPWPSVTGMARIALEAGAAGITVHPRPDERHIRRSDVFDLAKLIKSEFPDREFNIEGYPSDDFLALCESAAPEQATFVPDDPSQATSDHGWDIAAHAEMLTAAVKRMHKAGIRVSLFTDADAGAPARAAGVGADRIELYTGPYGGAFDPAEAAARRAELAATADAARRLKPPVLVNAGHDLTLANLPPLKAAIPDLAEVSIGHALIADALILGMAEAVRRYIAALA